MESNSRDGDVSSFVRRISVGGFLAGALLLCPSCATIPGVRKITVPKGQISAEGQKVKGLNESIDEASANGGALHLFLVHGMSNQPFGDPKELGSGIYSYGDVVEKFKNDKEWRVRNEAMLTERATKAQFEELVSRTADKLGTTEKISEKLTWIEDKKGVMGYQVRTEYKGASAEGRQRRLVVHRNCWAFTVIPFKSELLALDNDPARDRYFLNKMLKDSIVTWGLMDAALYVGSQRNRMQDAVSRGLAMVGKEDLKNGRFAFGAASLGSIITLDTMARDASKLDSDIKNAFFREEQPLYFFANQVGLLGAGDKDPLKSVAKANQTAIVAPELSTSLQNFAKSADPTTKSETAKLTVIAFNDPADFLGYPVPAQENDSVEFRIVNVSVRNQGLGIWGTVVNPLDAHGGFPKTRGVVKILTEGIKALPAPLAESQ